MLNVCPLQELQRALQRSEKDLQVYRGMAEAADRPQGETHLLLEVWEMDNLRRVRQVSRLIVNQDSCHLANFYSDPF